MNRYDRYLAEKHQNAAIAFLETIHAEINAKRPISADDEYEAGAYNATEARRSEFKDRCVHEVPSSVSHRTPIPVTCSIYEKTY